MVYNYTVRSFNGPTLKPPGNPACFTSIGQKMCIDIKKE